MTVPLPSPPNLIVSIGAAGGAGGGVNVAATVVLAVSEIVQDAVPRQDTPVPDQPWKVEVPVGFAVSVMLVFVGQLWLQTAVQDPVVGAAVAL